MKKLFLISVLAAVCNCLSAQEVITSTVDTVAYVPEPCAVEKASSLLEELDVQQSPALGNSFLEYVSENASRRVNCYRVRIYFDSSRDAREVSESIEKRFSELYPDIPVYRIYNSPFFKVTVGDFRTRDEAHRFANSIAGQFPSSFLVKETTRFPSLWSSKD